MTTNKNISPKEPLAVLGTALIQAAHNYWTEYQKSVGSAAVVWLENDNGHFILFTRSEYKDAILGAATRECRHEPKLFDPFVK